MPDSKTYKHIKVGPVENDELVIKAGKSNIDKVGNASESVSKASEVTNEEVPKKDIAANGKAESGETTKPGSSYKPTTLEDLKTSKMSWTQIVVIAVALIAISAFIFWYIVFS